MEKINKFFEWIDRFNVPISFRYKGDDNYSTFLGGLITTIIFLLTAGFGIYYFIPFVNRKNYSLYYYTINLNQTEEITKTGISNLSYMPSRKLILKKNISIQNPNLLPKKYYNNKIFY